MRRYSYKILQWRKIKTRSTNSTQLRLLLTSEKKGWKTSLNSLRYFRCKIMMIQYQTVWPKYKFIWIVVRRMESCAPGLTRWNFVFCFFPLKNTHVTGFPYEWCASLFLSLSLYLPSPSQGRFLPLLKIVKLAWLEGEIW